MQFINQVDTNTNQNGVIIVTLVINCLIIQTHACQSQSRQQNLDKTAPSIKYQVAKVSPGGSFTPFAPLVGRESVNEGSEGEQRGAKGVKAFLY